MTMPAKKMLLFREVKTLPPCKKCGAKTANFKSLICQPCKSKV